MCNFFSVISDGKGKVLFFTIEDVAKIMSLGNKDNLAFNSHTSIAHYNNIKGYAEDKWNKWEYDVNKKELKRDTINADDDGESVKKAIEEYLEGKDLEYMQNLYNRNTGSCNSGSSNSGNWNSGDWNSGDSNSGNWNSGDSNSGDSNSGSSNSGNCNSGSWNSGDWNSGDSNSGDRNTGNWNSGNRNSGSWNSGNWNSGSRNTGNRNSGSWNSGSWNTGSCNSGSRNSGNRNSGSWNSGDGAMNILCSEKVYLVFNKKCTKKEYEAAQNIMTKIAHHFYLTRWVYSREMTEEEKAQYPSHNVCDGYLKKYEYKEAFKNALDKCSLEIIKEIKTIKNFNDKKFKEISGCDLNEIIKSKENKNANK